MEPQIQFARTADGVSIACATVGEGPPLMFLWQPFWSHLQLEWRQAVTRMLIGGVADHHTLVRLDSRGTGLSQRVVTDLSLDARIGDIESVVGRLDLQRFALMTYEGGTSTAVAYAARHAEQVSHLILMNGFARWEDYAAMPKVRALGALRARDWELFTDSIGSVSFGAGRTETQEYGEFIRASVAPEMLARLFAAVSQDDVTELFPRLAMPTLVLHHTGLAYVNIEMARDLAARIPNAQLVVIEGKYLDDTDKIFSAVDRHLGVERDQRVSFGGESGAPGMTAILFTDIVDSTALTERMGDEAFRSKARDLDTAMRVAIRDCGGTPVDGKLLGDGVLAVFTSARAAIDAALRCGAAGHAGGLPLHLGIHAGDVIREQGNIYGGAVNIASRISGLSAPGELLVSDTVRSLARTSAGVRFEDRGEHALKGVADAQRVFAVTREP